MSLSRDETVRLMVMNDTQWKEASYLQDLLSTLKQREANLDAKDVKGERTGYFYAALAMFTFTFHSTTEPYYDKKRKCLWHLGWRGPKQPESPELEIRKTYYIVRESRYLCVYADRKQHSKWIARFDMLNPEHRQSFVDVRRCAAKKYPQTGSPLKDKSLERIREMRGSPPKHRSLERVRGMRGHQSTGESIRGARKTSLETPRRIHNEGHRKSRLVDGEGAAEED